MSSTAVDTRVWFEVVCVIKTCNLIRNFLSTKAVSVMMTIKEREDLDNGNRCESWV